MILNNNKISKVYLNSIFFIVTIIILQLSFNYNFFNAASDDFFDTHQKDSEALVLGKIISSKYENIINNKSMGKYSKDIKENYEMYYHDIKPNSDFMPYYSSFGLQGYIYSELDKLFTTFNISSYGKLSIMHFLTALGMSLSFAIFILLVKKEFGFFPAILLLVMVVFSQWLVVFAKNLYWIFFLNFIPFIYIWYKIQNIEFNNFSKSIYIGIFLLIFVKSLCGFEYLSTIFISLGIPLLYFSIKNKLGIKKFLKIGFLLYLSSFLGFFAAIFLHILQKIFFLGTFSQAINLLVYDILKRTHASPESVDLVFKRSLESSYSEVILQYWNGKALDFYSIFGKVLFITFGEFVIYLLILTIIFLIFLRANILNKINNNSIVSLFIITWVSILAPLSWYVLAKGHSYIHTHMNHILWYIPFLLFIPILTGLLFKNIIYRDKNTIKLLLSIFCIFCIFFVFNAKEINKKFDFYLTNNFKVYSDKNIEIYLKKDINSLIYFQNECKYNLDSKFFLHVIPYDLNLLPLELKKYGFINMDFNWYDSEFRTYNIFSKYIGSCMVIKDLSGITVKSINTGEYNKIERLWETKKIELEYFNNKPVELISYNLTDDNWENGISLHNSAFFIENTFFNKEMLKVGDKLKFNYSGDKVIVDLIYNDKYINIFVEGEKLDSIKDGYPNKIKLIKKENK